MGMTPLLSDRHGTAAIEFALVAPIMALLIVGLADGVRRNLAMIDLDAATHTVARRVAASAMGPTRPAARMMRGRNGAATSVTVIDCPGPSRRGGGCTGLPPGRYVTVSVSRHVSSLFGRLRDPLLQSTALVRLP